MPENKIATPKIQEFRTKLLGWYRESSRCFGWRDTRKSDYEKIIAEILLQRTQAKNVCQVYERFLETFPSWEKIAKTRISTLEKELKPLGLWKQRSQSLKNLAKALLENGGKVPSERKKIDQLPGVGQYIANAIELLIFNRPLPLVDVNMARVLERYFGPRKLADSCHLTARSYWFKCCVSMLYFPYHI